MKKLTPIFLLALIANLITIITWIALSSLGNTDHGNKLQSLFIIFIIPLFWFIVIIIALILSLRKRKELFKKRLLIWTILILLCCTPIPVITISLLSRSPETTNTPAEYSNKDGKAYKTEKWYYVPSGLYVEKTFIADSALAIKVNDDSVYKKDGTWVYFKYNGDTLKTEYWKNGKEILKSKK
jgi:glucan phosphoethanolaminetransferase (alkaline phosphatase superfamily)